MDLNEEKELIKLAQKDPEVFAKVYSHYYPKIFGYVLKRTANLEIAQDIVSETFFKALHKLWQFRWRNISFSSWLYKIATNEINQYFRKGKYKSVSLDKLQEQGFEPVSLHNPEAEVIEAQEKLKQRQDFLVCQEKIGQLDIKYQEVITLRFFEQKQIKEIGEILGKSEGTIKSLLHRGLEKLRGSMAEESKTQPFAKSRIVDSERSKTIINKKYPEL
ncbi:MAG: RNA polymerase sigma factor [Candidatus Azambacteria bacterium]|nr:RNA polymerase sigma factor [Candidatus Azambacteria bacterium]